MTTKGDITFNGTDDFTDAQMFKFIKESVAKQNLDDNMTNICLKLLDRTETKFNKIKKANSVYEQIIEFNDSIATTKQKDQLIKKQRGMLLNE